MSDISLRLECLRVHSQLISLTHHWTYLLISWGTKINVASYVVLASLVCWQHVWAMSVISWTCQTLREWGRPGPWTTPCRCCPPSNSASNHGNTNSSYHLQGSSLAMAPSWSVIQRTIHRNPRNSKLAAGEVKPRWTNWGSGRCRFSEWPLLGWCPSIGGAAGGHYHWQQHNPHIQSASYKDAMLFTITGTTVAQ